MLPKSFRLGSRDIKIILSDTTAQDFVYGKYYDAEGEIHISKFLSVHMQRVTLLHEVLHACFSFVGVQGDEELTEEQVCSRLDNVLYTVLTENPSILKN